MVLEYPHRNSQRMASARNGSQEHRLNHKSLKTHNETEGGDAIADMPDGMVHKGVEFISHVHIGKKAHRMNMGKGTHLDKKLSR